MEINKNSSDNISKEKSTKVFILVAFLLFTAMLIVEKINGRFWLNDFKVFYLAAKALINNEQVYGVAFGLETGFYKYSPFTLLLFTPFTVLSFETASIVYFYFSVTSIISTIIIIDVLLRSYFYPLKKPNSLILFAILLCTVNHLVRELHLGNSNMILVLLLCLSLKFALELKPVLSGSLLAVVILTKPYFIICLLPFILIKKHKEVLSTLIAIMLFVVITFCLTGLSKSVILFTEWFHAMKEHSSYLTSRHTVFSLLEYYFNISLSSSLGIYFLAAIGIISLVSIWIRNYYRKIPLQIPDGNKSLIIYFFLLIAIIPSLLITDTEHFLFAMPLIALLILYLNKSKNYVGIILFIVLMFLYGGNSSDLVGKHLAARFEEFGFLGISNLIIIGVVSYLYCRHRLLDFAQRS